MELLEQLLLDDVKSDETEIVLIFLDLERGEIREVKWRKRAWDESTRKFVDNESKLQEVEEWSQKYFGLPHENLAQAIGERKDVYCYDTYNSLWLSTALKKFDKDMVGQILQVDVKDVVDTGTEIRILFDLEGDTYASRMKYSKYIEAKKQYFVNPIQKTKVYAKFEEKFHIPIEDKEQLVGQSVMIEVKSVFNNPYAEVKPFPKKKK